MKITKLISVKQTNGKLGHNAQPEWACVVELEDGTRHFIDRVIQWNQPEAHHLQDTLDRFPLLFDELKLAGD